MDRNNIKKHIENKTKKQHRNHSHSHSHSHSTSFTNKTATLPRSNAMNTSIAAGASYFQMLPSTLTTSDKQITMKADDWKNEQSIVDETAKVDPLPSSKGHTWQTYMAFMHSIHAIGAKVFNFSAYSIGMQSLSADTAALISYDQIVDGLVSLIAGIAVAFALMHEVRDDICKCVNIIKIPNTQKDPYSEILLPTITASNWQPTNDVTSSCESDAPGTKMVNDKRDDAQVPDKDFNELKSNDHSTNSIAGHQTSKIEPKAIHRSQSSLLAPIVTRTPSQLSQNAVYERKRSTESNYTKNSPNIVLSPETTLSTERSSSIASNSMSRSVSSHLAISSSLDVKKSEFVHIALQGTQFIKYGRFGKPHSRRVLICMMKSVLVLDWETGHFNVDDIVGCFEGTASDVFQRKNNRNADPTKCFTIVTNKRTLNLQAETTADRDLWIAGIHSLANLNYADRIASKNLFISAWSDSYPPHQRHAVKQLMLSNTMQRSRRDVFRTDVSRNASSMLGSQNSFISNFSADERFDEKHLGSNSLNRRENSYASGRFTSLSPSIRLNQLHSLRGVSIGGSASQLAIGHSPATPRAFADSVFDFN